VETKPKNMITIKINKGDRVHLLGCPNMTGTVMFQQHVRYGILMDNNEHGYSDIFGYNGKKFRHELKRNLVKL
jgi:hypothetical protein